MIALPEQPLAERILRQALARPDPPQQILVFGPPGTGKRDAARRLAWALSAPGHAHDPEEVSLDIRRLVGTGAEIRREEIEEAFTEIHTRPMVHERRVLVIEEAERLRSSNAASLLLKTLEEPPSRAVLILVTDLVEDLLPTIRSRCVPVPFRFPGWRAVEARRSPLVREMRALGVDLGIQALRGSGRPGEAVAGAQARMEELAAATPSDELLRLRAEAEAKAGKRGERTALKRVEDQARREARRVVTDGWRDVLAGMAEATRDALALALGAGSVHHEERRDDLARVAADADPDALIGVMEAIELRRGELVVNPTTDLAMEGLLATIAAALRGEQPRLVSPGRLPYVVT